VKSLMIRPQDDALGSQHRSVARWLIGCRDCEGIDVVSVVSLVELAAIAVTSVCSGRGSVSTDVDDAEGRSGKPIALLASSPGTPSDIGRCEIIRLGIRGIAVG
jgi:hypothetical protein